VGALSIFLADGVFKWNYVAARRKIQALHRVRDIILSWVATLPLGAVLAVAFYWLLRR